MKNRFNSKPKKVVRKPVDSNIVLLWRGLVGVFKKLCELYNKLRFFVVIVVLVIKIILSRIVVKFMNTRFVKELKKFVCKFLDSYIVSNSIALWQVFVDIVIMQKVWKLYIKLVLFVIEWIEIILSRIVVKFMNTRFVKELKKFVRKFLDSYIVNDSIALWQVFNYLVIQNLWILCQKLVIGSILLVALILYLIGLGIAKCMRTNFKKIIRKFFKELYELFFDSTAPIRKVLKQCGTKTGCFVLLNNLFVVVQKLGVELKAKMYEWVFVIGSWIRGLLAKIYAKIHAEISRRVGKIEELIINKIDELAQREPNENTKLKRAVIR